MKKKGLILSMLSFALLLGACTAPTEPTIVRETVVSELPVTVEVTRIVPQVEEVTRVVEAPMTVEVTRLVEAEVEVTRVVEIVRLGRPVTAEELIGYWIGDVFISFADDGTFAAGQTKEMALNNPFDLGRYEFDGTVLTLYSASNSVCSGGIVATYKAFFNEDGRLELDVIQDSCKGSEAEGDSREYALSFPLRRVE